MKVCFARISLLALFFLLNSCVTTNKVTQESAQDSAVRSPAGAPVDDIVRNYYKVVLMLSPANLAYAENRERQLEYALADRAKYCAQRAAKKFGPFASQNIFYFSVDGNGQLGEVLGEADRDDAQTKNFHICMYDVIAKTRVSSGGNKESFRLKVSTTGAQGMNPDTPAM